jgi:hypothetical protein
MSEGTHEATVPDAAGDVAAARRAPAPTGDLEFDEAWSEPHEGGEVTPEPQSREVPSFEDPNDR